MYDAPMPSLWSRARGLILFGWLVALIRFGIDAKYHPVRWEPLFFVGVYFLMPIAFLVAGIRGTFDDMSWKRLALMAILIGLLVWGLPNLITYTTARFLGWTEGRFAPPKGRLSVRRRRAREDALGLSRQSSPAVIERPWSCSGPRC